LIIKYQTKNSTHFSDDASERRRKDARKRYQSFRLPLDV